MNSISAIIPTLNESANIESMLLFMRKLDPALELIVVDAYSDDDTVNKAKRYAHVITSERGRGVQMNAGARIARGEIFWFLHADCLPHPQSVHTMRHVLANPNIVGGAFEYELDHPGLHYQLAVSLSNMKNKFFKLLFGDMGIFVRREIFYQMNGFRMIPLMEDMDFSIRLKKQGSVVILPFRMHTSARRWVDEGYVKHSVRSWVFQSAYALGASPNILARFYKFK